MKINQEEIFLLSKGSHGAVDFQTAFLSAQSAQSYIQREYPEFSEIDTSPADRSIHHYKPNNINDFIIVEPIPFEEDFDKDGSI